MEVYPRSIRRGSAQHSIYVELRDSTTNDVKTGMAYNSAGIVTSYTRGQGARVAITPVDLAAPTTVWTSGGFKEVDAANCPGLYRFDIPDAAFATNDLSDVVTVSIKMTNVKSVNIMIPLSDVSDVALSPGTVRVNS